MAITAPLVVRYTILGRWTNGHAADTVLDYLVDDDIGVGGLSRDEAMVRHADDIIQNWQSQVLPPLSNNYQVLGIRYMDLNAEDGITGERVPNTSEDVTGGDATPSMGPQVCYLVKKLTTSARGTRQGRIYVPGVAEGAVNEDGGVSMGADTITQLQAGLTAFLANTEQGDLLDGLTARMVVTHFGPRPAPGQEDNRVGTRSNVSQLIVDTRVATQRRRLR